MKRCTLFLAILSVGFGCGDRWLFPEHDGPDNSVGSPAHAELKVIGTGPNGELTFEEVEPGTSKTKTIVIKNEGDYPLKIDQWKLGPNPHFSYEVLTEDPSATP